MRRIALLLPLLALAGCGAATVPPEQIAEKAETLLERQVGVRPEIVCPEEMPAEVGASARCSLTAGDDPTEYGVTVTVEAVDDDEPEYGVEVDREPLERPPA